MRTEAALSISESNVQATVERVEQQIEALQRTHETRFMDLHKDLAGIVWELSKLRADMARWQALAQLAVQEALGSHFEVVFAGDHCDMDVPTALATLQPAIYIQPGGGDDMAEAWAAVGPVKSAIREYVRGGGRYVGICMGAFLSSKGAEDDDFEGFDLLSEAGWDAHDYKETEGADVTDMNQTLVEVEWRSNNARIFFQGGPSFVKLPAEQVTGRVAGEVLATYTNGDAAAIVVPFGDGKVGVIGPHPEATKSWYADVVNDGGPEGEPPPPLPPDDDPEKVPLALRLVPSVIEGLTLHHDFVTEDEESVMLKTIDAQPWDVTIRRRTQHYGRRFDYHKKTVGDDATPLPEDLRIPLVQRLCTAQPALVPWLNADASCIQCTINEYVPGIGIASHVDTHSAFEDGIASLTLGGGCAFRLQRASDGADLSIWLPPRSLLILRGAARYQWKHSISGRKFDRVELDASSDGVGDVRTLVSDRERAVASSLGPLVSLEKRGYQWSQTAGQVRVVLSLGSVARAMAPATAPGAPPAVTAPVTAPGAPPAVTAPVTAPGAPPAVEACEFSETSCRLRVLALSSTGSLQRLFFDVGALYRAIDPSRSQCVLSKQRARVTLVLAKREAGCEWVRLRA
eukprot:jgi/Chrpa1/18319/Chrysochromulina_OHIO_Genome00004172-RA